MWKFSSYCLEKLTGETWVSRPSWRTLTGLSIFLYGVFCVWALEITLSAGGDLFGRILSCYVLSRPWQCKPEIRPFLMLDWALLNCTGDFAFEWTESSRLVKFVFISLWIKLGFLPNPLLFWFKGIVIMLSPTYIVPKFLVIYVCIFELINVEWSLA